MLAAPGPARTIIMARLGSCPDVKIVASATDEAAAIEKMVTEDADIAVVHIHMTGRLAGLDIARNIQKACPEAGILIIVDDIAGINLRRNARQFGVSWSYVRRQRTDDGAAFADIIRSVGRGIHFIDPEIRRVLEAIWAVASEARDMDNVAIAQKPQPAGETSTEIDADELDVEDDEAEDDGPAPRGIQSFSTGNSGVGRSFNAKTSRAS